MRLFKHVELEKLLIYHVDSMKKKLKIHSYAYIITIHEKFYYESLLLQT
jgi:hypothetical protein